MALKVKKIKYGHFPKRAQKSIVKAVVKALPSYKNGWQCFQNAVASSLKRKFKSLQENAPLENYGVKKSKAELDFCFDMRGGRRVLGQVCGRTQPRIEKELLGFLAVACANKRSHYGVLIVPSDNALNLEGDRSSFDYSSRALLHLVKPLLAELECRFKGLLIVGYDMPAAHT